MSFNLLRVHSPYTQHYVHYHTCMYMYNSRPLTFQSAWATYILLSYLCDERRLLPTDESLPTLHEPVANKVMTVLESGKEGSSILKLGTMYKSQYA